MSLLIFLRGALGGNRYRAAGAFLAASVIIAGLAYYSIQFVWYPDALFAAAGGRKLFLLIAGVEVVLGPLIIFIIFVPGKKGLVFDLVVIVLLQVAALSYGAWVLYQSRPAYLVFVKDRFELMRALDIPEVEIERAQGGPFANLPVTGPRIVGSRMPTDPREVTRLTFAASQGVDLHYFPRYYVAYDEVRRDVRAFAKPIPRLRALNPGAGTEIDRLIATLGKRETDLAFLPVRVGKRDLTAMIDAANGDVLKLVALRPWEY